MATKAGIVGGGWARAILLVPIALTGASCSRPPPPIETEDARHAAVSDLLRRGAILLDPATAAPFTGGVFDAFDDDPKRIRFRGRVQDGLRNGDFEFYDRDGVGIWTHSRYDRGFPCGEWLLRTRPGADGPAMTDTVSWRNEVEERLPVPFADVMRESVPTTRGVLYPPCPLDFGNPYSEPPLEDGRYESYFAEGKLRLKGAYLDGERTGRWETYRVTGELALIETFVGGQRHGPYREIARGGDVRRDGYYGHGERCGQWIEWGARSTHSPCPTPTDTVS